MMFLPGSTAKLQWTYNCSEFCDLYWRYRYRRRLDWYFTSSDGGQTERLAGSRIYRDSKPVIYNSSLPDVCVQKPATLILKNVDLRYNGTYLFQLDGLFHYSRAQILVFIAGKCYFFVIQLNLCYIFDNQIVKIKIMCYFKFVVQFYCIRRSFCRITRSRTDYVHS